MKEKKVFKAAVVQAAPIFLDKDATIEKGIALIKEAAANKADIIAFPETWIPGYPWWIWLGSPAWGMQFVGQYFENSLVVDSPQAKLITKAALDNNINVVMGFSEKHGGSLYMSQMIIDRTGKILGVRSKMKPTHAERTVFGDGDPSGLATWQLDIGRVGALNCWENLLSLLKYSLFSMGEQIHVASWPSFSLYRGAAYGFSAELNTAATQVLACEGGVFTLMACATVSQEMIKMLCDTPDKGELLLEGGGFAAIFAPDGRPITKPLPETAEGILYADIDIGMLGIAKNAMDPVGHYSRPDAVRLLLNTNSSPKVERFSLPMKETQPVKTQEFVPPVAEQTPAEQQKKF